MNSPSYSDKHILRFWEYMKRGRRTAGAPAFLYNRKLRRRKTFQGEFAEANSQETCTPLHVFCTIGNCDSEKMCSQEHVFCLWKHTFPLRSGGMDIEA